MTKICVIKYNGALKYVYPLILICMGSCNRSLFLGKSQMQMTVIAEPGDVAVSYTCVRVCVCQSQWCFIPVCKQHYCMIYSKL